MRKISGNFNKEVQGAVNTIISARSNEIPYPDDILREYNEHKVGNFGQQEPDGDIRKMVLDAAEANNQDFFDRLTYRVERYFYLNIGTVEFYNEVNDNMLRFMRFMLDLPSEYFVSLMDGLISRNSYSSYLIVRLFHNCNDSKQFQETIIPMYMLDNELIIYDKSEWSPLRINSVYELS